MGKAQCIGSDHLLLSSQETRKEKQVCGLSVKGGPVQSDSPVMCIGLYLAWFKGDSASNFFTVLIFDFFFSQSYHFTLWVQILLLWKNPCPPGHVYFFSMKPERRHSVKQCLLGFTGLWITGCVCAVVQQSCLWFSGDQSWDTGLEVLILQDWLEICLASQKPISLVTSYKSFI